MAGDDRYISGELLEPFVVGRLESRLLDPLLGHSVDPVDLLTMSFAAYPSLSGVSGLDVYQCFAEFLPAKPAGEDGCRRFSLPAVCGALPGWFAQP